jgi:hypothetical protein
MAIFLLEPVLPLARKWENYRKQRRLIVRAPDEATARLVAAEQASLAGREDMLRLLPDENDDPLANPWLDPELAGCTRIDPDGPPETLAAEAP